MNCNLNFCGNGIQYVHVLADLLVNVVVIHELKMGISLFFILDYELIIGLRSASVLK